MNRSNFSKNDRSRGKRLAVNLHLKQAQDFTKLEVAKLLSSTVHNIFIPDDFACLAIYLYPYVLPHLVIYHFAVTKKKPTVRPEKLAKSFISKERHEIK